MFCPIENNQYDTVTLAHGGGGKLTQNLIERVFLQEFGNELLNTMQDSTIVPVLNQHIAVTTDSYVIKPVFFPGGDIGKLAVCGTINDLLMSGAEPQYLTCGFIIEEGFKISDLHKIVHSMSITALANNIKIIAGDTKVIERINKEPNVFINTTGIGLLTNNIKINPSRIQPGDVIIVSGDIGRHGIAVMACREGLSFESEIKSDCASLQPIVKDLMRNLKNEIHCMRDLTRGGLATINIELAEQSKLNMELYNFKIPIAKEVHAVCELLGLNPLFCANEGRFILILPKDHANDALSIINDYNKTYNSLPAAIIGMVVKCDSMPNAKLITSFGSSYKLSKQTGEQLPRIC